MKKETWQNRAENRRMLKFSYRQRARRNVIYLSTANSLTHESKKTTICYHLKKLGYEFYTEAELNGGGRADIFVTDIPIAIEIIETETIDSIKQKQQYYPCRLIPITTGQQFREELML